MWKGLLVQAVPQGQVRGSQWMYDSLLRQFSVQPTSTSLPSAWRTRRGLSKRYKRKGGSQQWGCCNMAHTLCQCHTAENASKPRRREQNTR